MGKKIFDNERIRGIITENSNILSEFKKVCGNDMKSMLLDALSGTIESWYVRWAFDHFLKENYAVYPTESKVKNIGFIQEATHCTGINTYVSKNDIKHKEEFDFIELTLPNDNIKKHFLKYFKRIYKLNFRIKLIANSRGRKLLRNEIRIRILNKDKPPYL